MVQGSPAQSRLERVLEQLEHTGVRLGLERIRRLLADLGEPQRTVPTVLVAGTNGKGSTASYLAAMARAAGYRTGLFSSPHLETVTERIALDGRPLGEEALADLIEDGVARAARLGAEPPTYFESLTIAAFRAFAGAAVDLAVIEVGLGGRLDATNAGEPLLSLITSIGFDHQRLLGDSLAAIAGEKAGILRRGRPAIAWAGDHRVERALRRKARTVGADLVFAEHQVLIRPRSPAHARPQRAEIRTDRHRHRLETHLGGHHQLRNLAVATLAAETLAGLEWPLLDAAAIARGAAACRWPGRLEWVDLPDGRRVLLDGAHNGAGIDALTAYLDALPAPVDILFGALGDKKIDAMLPPLDARARRLLLTRPPSPRAGDPEVWLGALPASRRAEVEVECDPERALSLALDAGDLPLVVCGSLYLIGAVRGWLRDRFGVPPAPLETPAP